MKQFTSLQITGKSKVSDKELKASLKDLNNKKNNYSVHIGKMSIEDEIELVLIFEVDIEED